MLVKAKKWGNSVGFIIPKKIAMELKVKPGEEYFIPKIERKSNVLKEMFGALPDLSAEDLKKYRKETKMSKYDDDF